ncbi:hypothetical protein BDV95DRAFT_595864 [Massariosphaeria phaeospora]|uniref:Uncharacterized protein n=1 Tax=Massariosphaeria phaeospora TaxID=100035 RepID=A0A7C8I7U4_9PLEO|nr:hypothetical protein BDV95DRAFT_595864 [Massariosphaeria phaeospora]
MQVRNPPPMENEEDALRWSAVPPPLNRHLAHVQKESQLRPLYPLYPLPRSATPSRVEEEIYKQIEMMKELSSAVHAPQREAPARPSRAKTVNLESEHTSSFPPRYDSVPIVRALQTPTSQPTPILEVLGKRPVSGLYTDSKGRYWSYSKEEPERYLMLKDREVDIVQTAREAFKEGKQRWSPRPLRIWEMQGVAEVLEKKQEQLKSNPEPAKQMQWGAEVQEESHSNPEPAKQMQNVADVLMKEDQRQPQLERNPEPAKQMQNVAETSKESPAKLKPNPEPTRRGLPEPRLNRDEIKTADLEKLRTHIRTVLEEQHRNKQQAKAKALIG